MIKFKKRLILFALILTFGLGLFRPVNAYAQESSAKSKWLHIDQKLTALDETGKNYKCKLTWKAVKGCQYYEVYRNNKLLATISDGKCKYTDKTLKYGKKYTYLIYACKKVDGVLVQKYYDLTYADVKVATFELNENYDEDGFYEYSSGQLAIQFETTFGKDMLEPDYLEVKRLNLTTNKTKKTVLSWSDLDINENQYTYYDSTVKEGTTYQYTVRCYKLINGKKKYSDSNTFFPMTAK